MYLKRFSTGLDRLDEVLKGGIVAGSVLLVTGKPGSMAELLPFSLTYENPTRYLTFRRLPDNINRSIKISDIDSGDPKIEAIDPDLDNVLLSIEDDQTEITIAEPIDAIERQITEKDSELDSEQYWNQLNTVSQKTDSTDSLTVLYGYDGRMVTEYRDITETIADIIFQFENSNDSGSMGPVIHVPKIRGGPGLTDPLQVTYEDGFDIDITRNVA